ncbi:MULTISPECIES: di-heme oxidoreductase family protein [Chitinophagaceae]
MKKLSVISAIAIVVFAFSMCHKADNEGFANSEYGYDPRLSGGMATTFDNGKDAFGQGTSGLDARQEAIFNKGDNLFSQTFVSGHAYVFGGLGPIFVNTSCGNCHHNEAKGAPTVGASNSSLLFRLSILGEDSYGGPIGIPGFGTQLQNRAVTNVQPEAGVSITYKDSVVNYPDGSSVLLRVPGYELTNPYTDLPASYMISPRMAPMTFGLGLLENIPEATILAHADPDDADGDGISGKANYVYDQYYNTKMIGRFGWKANVATLPSQVASAAQQDMGVTNYIFPQENCYGQPQYTAAANDDKMVDSLLNYLIFYTRTLAVPARRGFDDSTAQQGAQIFEQIKCNACHLTTLQTGTNVTIAPLSNQRIHPYTDLLLHDMGPALSDGRPDYLASATEWRTAPLWGIGLLGIVNGTPYYLHDGRARSAEEAILWHGGEATKVKGNFMALNQSDRNKLLKFIASL